MLSLPIRKVFPKIKIKVIILEVLDFLVMAIWIIIIAFIIIIIALVIIIL